VGVTGLSEGRILRPHCRVFETPGGGSSLQVDEELTRAIRSQSSLAIHCW